MDRQHTSSSPPSQAASRGASARPQGIAEKASETIQTLSEKAQDAGKEAKEAVARMSSEATGTIKGALNSRVSASADLVNAVAQSVNLAADNLSSSAPQLADLARGAARKIEDISAQTRDKSVDELFEAASDFARKQPAVVFGAGAVFGFALFRLFKTGNGNHARGRGRGLESVGENRQSARRNPTDSWPATPSST